MPCCREEPLISLVVSSRSFQWEKAGDLWKSMNKLPTEVIGCYIDGISIFYHIITFYCSSIGVKNPVTTNNNPQGLLQHHGKSSTQSDTVLKLELGMLFQIKTEKNKNELRLNPLNPSVISLYFPDVFLRCRATRGSSGTPPSAQKRDGGVEKTHRDDGRNEMQHALATWLVEARLEFNHENCDELLGIDGITGL